MKIELSEFKKDTKDVMLIVVFEESSNFRLVQDKGKATWVPKWKEVQRIIKALKVIDSGNKVNNPTNVRNTEKLKQI